MVDYKKAGFGLGLLSVAIGAAELLAPKKIAAALDSEGREGVVKAFGLRELVAGAGLLGQPAHSAMVWNRVAGDGMDLFALGRAARNSPKNRAIWGALGFVGVVTVIDILVARGLDKETGRFIPSPSQGA